VNSGNGEPGRPRVVLQYVDSDVFGGSERVLLQLLRGLDRSRWHPVLLHHAASGLARLLDEARAAGVPVRTAPRVTDANLLFRLPALVRAVSLDRPAVFHAHLNWPLACKFGLAAAAVRRVPAIVATVHLVPDDLMNRNVRAQVRAVGATVHRYLAVANHVRDRLAALGLPGRKLRVVRNGIDTAELLRPANPELRIRLSGAPQRPVILTVARLARQKGIDVLLSAASQVPDAVFLIAGEGPERTALEGRAAALGLGNSVRFLGAAHNVPDLLAACDVFVLPSLAEGLPLSVLEAMAAGKPIVATRIAGTDEAVADGTTGVLVPPRDPDALAMAIRSLLADPDRASRLARAGQERVQSEFPVGRTVAAVAAQYEEVLGR
jgi:glycosyltransferase involved in cell wall biosynthesis